MKATFLSHARTHAADDDHDELVDRAASGDSEALGTIYDLHHAAVRAFARRCLGDESLAEDLVHEVFVALPPLLLRYSGRSTLRTFILATAANYARHVARSRARRLKTLRRYHDALDRPAPPRPDELDERRRLSAMLERGLATLPIEQRMVVILAGLEERTAPEVSEILGIPQATVRTRLFHARRKLREYLETVEGWP